MNKPRAKTPPSNAQTKQANAAIAPSAAPANTFLKIAFACMLALGLLGLSACASSPKTNTGEKGSSAKNSSAPQKVAEGSEAPDFSFVTTDGETAKLSDYEGKVVLVNFWATWCGYCIEEMPAMQKITENYPEVVVLAINRGDTEPEARAFAQKNNYDFVWGLDDEGEIQKLYPSNGIPYSIIIDKQGVVGSIFEGSASDMYPHFEEAVSLAGA